MPDARIRVLLLVRRLDLGGAERQMIELARGLDKRRFDVAILTFYAGGELESHIAPDAGIRLDCLNKAGRYDLLPFVSRLLRTVRRLKPHIVHGYMSVANELSIVAGRFCGAKVVWGLRATDVDDANTATDRFLRCAGALLSRQPDCIIANSESVRSVYAANGYCDARMTVIPNGIDTGHFSVLPMERERLRQEWNIRPDELLIGRVGRLHPMKDHPSFLRAAGAVSRVRSDARFVCVGTGTDCAEMREIAAREGIAERVVWAGSRRDMPAVYNALDINVSSSSFGEGFPNAVAESMACGTPCVVTDVGDSAMLVEGTGIAVPPSDPMRLADGILRLADAPAAGLRSTVRRRITDEFGAERLIARTEAQFDRLVPATGPRQR